MFDFFFIVVFFVFQLHWLDGTNALIFCFPPQLDMILPLLIGCPFKFGNAAPPITSLQVE